MVEEKTDKGYDIFDDAPKGNFLKLKDGEEKVIGIKSRRCDFVSYGKDTAGNAHEPKPSVILELDYIDGELKEVSEWTTSAIYMKEKIEKYEKAPKDEPNLFGWYFRLSRKGTGMETKYDMIPTKPKKQ